MDYFASCFYSPFYKEKARHALWLQIKSEIFLRVACRQLFEEGLARALLQFVSALAPCRAGSAFQDFEDK